MLITSVSNPKVKALRKLKERKYREQSATHLVEGIRAIEEGLENGATLECLLYEEDACNDPAMNQLLYDTGSLGIEYLPTTREVLGSFSSRSNPHQAIGVFKQQWLSLDTITGNPNEVWIALESPRDPGNLGTIIRTAEASGAQGVILLDQACDPYSPEAMRASTGALFGISLVKASLTDFLEWVHTSSFELIGTGLTRSEDYRALAYDRPTIIAMGTERDGITSELENACHKMVRIPMRGKTDSLNLSVASALMLFEVTNRKYRD